MRFLKTKIFLANKALEKKLHLQSVFPIPAFKEVSTFENAKEFTQECFSSQSTTPSTPERSSELSISSHSSPKVRARAPKTKSTSQCSNTKNITINYGKAIVSFATSHLAIPYLTNFLLQENVSLSQFIAFVGQAKDNIGGISSFRSLLLISPSDDKDVAAYKRVFKLISEVFIKYFSVNWIINGKVTHKLTYLKYRFKMLRRIQDPEHFTYIREGRKKKSA